jgi:4-amino-4-deoxy-L-arabinose transferase-like glycosyltransferase
MQKIRSLFPLFLIFITATTARIIYGFYQPNISIVNDSLYYYSYGIRLLDSFNLNLLISPFRTPVYPIFIDLSLIINGIKDAQIWSPEFYKVLDTLVLMQTSLGILSSLCLYYIFLKIGVGKIISLIAALLYSLNMMVIPWERALLTESLAIFSVIIFAVCFLNVIRKPEIINYLVLLIVSAIIILLRPSLAPLPFISVFSTFGFRIKQKRKLLYSGIFLLLYLLIPVIWTAYNSNIHGYKGFQAIGDISILGRIMLIHIPLEAGKNEEFFYKTLTEYQNINNIHSPYLYLSWYDPNIYSNPDRLNQLSSFTRKIVISNIFTYILRSSGDIPESIGKISMWIIIPQSEKRFLGVIIRGLQNFFLKIQVAGIIAIISFFIYSLRKLHLYRRESFTVAVLSLTAIITVIFNVLIDYEDYSRISAPVMPLTYVGFIWIVSNIINKLSGKLKDRKFITSPGTK